jgi:hypothetical protein
LDAFGMRSVGDARLELRHRGWTRTWKHYVVGAGLQYRRRRGGLRSPACPGSFRDVAARVEKMCPKPRMRSNEDHLRRLLREYVADYNDERVHSSIG